MTFIYHLALHWSQAVNASMQFLVFLKKSTHFYYVAALTTAYNRVEVIITFKCVVSSELGFMYTYKEEIKYMHMFCVEQKGT